ncbi:MAG TPA: gamma-glutamyl-gamma-aminobutyrate hydrolase family protein [Thermoguttaceae bacterium]|nr:gamma-glutamyl-gamma-aminobutyrate hydrolase family protein [Thermoguttaceae bacterium]
MSRKPIVGLNADYQSSRANKPAFTYVNAGYADALSKAGAIPVILPIVEDRRDLSLMVDLLDAVVMVGGADLDPCRDGFMRHPSVRLLDRRREDFDRTLMAMAVERRMPIFGVGVGMQLLNLTLGGNLFLHLPEDLPRALPHSDPTDPFHRHALEVEPGSLMERVYGEGEIRVNSQHHMALDELGEGLTVTARCPDGVIEAVESMVEDWFVLGTQFHPENMSASALDLRIFEEFVAGVVGEPLEARMVA